ncbi:MAG: hypothetical protein ACLQNE_14565 [Thermoguttaceae bacterium]|jgi:hypothetical protein
MRTLVKKFVVSLVSVPLVACASLASAGDWQWDHPAGFKATGPVGGKNRYADASSRSYRSPSSTPTYASPAVANLASSSFAYQAFSYQPSAAAIKAGETVSVTRSASLMVGPKVVAAVPSGEVLRVAQIQGPWLWTAAAKDGRNVGGWIRIDDVTLAK